MPHAFDSRTLSGIVAAAEHLLARACDHEYRLSALADRVDGLPSPRPVAAGDLAAPMASAAPGRVGVRELTTAMRELCLAAREQRELAEAIVHRLLGDALATDSAPSGRWRVLVVDDSADNRDLAATVLEASGFEATTASNGLEALIAAHYLRPAVVLMDLTMPVLDGLEAARLLKASAATRDLKLVALTARPDLPLGPLFADVLRKPAMPEAIVASVQRLLDAHPP